MVHSHTFTHKKEITRPSPWQEGRLQPEEDALLAGTRLFHAPHFLRLKGVGISIQWPGSNLNQRN